MNVVTKTITLSDGRTITLETGKLAKQADGAVMVTMGKTMLLATVCSAQDAVPGTDFMPLTVEYKEKFASAGRFPGGFTRREGKASDYEILTARLVDRALRPLFPDNYHAETFVNVTLYSADGEVMPDINVGACNLKSFYQVVGAEADIAFAPNDAGNSLTVVSGGDAFFFDNVGYDVWLEFGSGCSDMAVTDESKAVEDLFAQHKNVLTGRINFNNDIGRSDFSFRYRKNGQVKSVTFTFEVLSTKLDYHKDWQLVFNDVERKYPMLAADYLRRTYHAFDREPKTDAPTPDLIWWNLFKEEQEPFIKACELVVSRPRRKLHPMVEYRRADQLRRLTPALENEFAEHRAETARLYRVEREDMSHDTVENRFVKYAIRFVSLNYDRLVKKIDKDYGGKLSETEKDEMTAFSAKLKRLCIHTVFRDVGRFTGLRQESSILQRAPGYSMVWRTFGILNASYMLYDVVDITIIMYGGVLS